MQGSAMPPNTMLAFHKYVMRVLQYLPQTGSPLVNSKIHPCDRRTEGRAVAYSALIICYMLSCGKNRSLHTHNAN